ncbi:hypothetical protein DSECCO2_504610 [anaerobic digester metagenome]
MTSQCEDAGVSAPFLIRDIFFIIHGQMIDAFRRSRKKKIPKYPCALLLDEGNESPRRPTDDVSDIKKNSSSLYYRGPYWTQIVDLRRKRQIYIHYRLPPMPP